MKSKSKAVKSLAAKSQEKSSKAKVVIKKDKNKNFTVMFSQELSVWVDYPVDVQATTQKEAEQKAIKSKAAQMNMEKVSELVEILASGKPTGRYSIDDVEESAE